MSPNDLLRRGDVAEMLKEKARWYTVSMFCTSSECNVARQVAYECANMIQEMSAFRKEGDE